ncbi:MAG: phosphoenolpyruvate--protein phosphotransferase [Holophaga sp.]|nr:phosphoenolpyruvate--protein phosphotransferase [Holophaga sp.]
MVVSAPASVLLDLLAPLSGILVPLESVPDPVFAGKLAGDGIAIDPTSSVLLAPVAGKITQLHRAHHAIAITSAEGVEVLLHIGLDTVELKGEGFTAKVSLGDRVDVGQPLISFDPVLVGLQAKSLLVMMVIANGERVGAMRAATGLVVAGKSQVLHLDLREPTAEAAPAGGDTVESRVVVLGNSFGLHARPAAILAGAARQFSSVVRLLRGAAEVNAKSVVAILGFEVKAGDSLQIKATGQDARKASDSLADLLASGCGEAPGAPAAAEASRPAAKGSAAGDLAGVAAAPGLAMGHVFQYRPQQMEVVEAGKDPTQEQAHLEAALRDAGLQIEAIKARVRAGADATRVGILSAHQELLLDPDLTELAATGIGAGKSAAFAWREAFTACATKLAGLESPLLRERANDIRDVGRRVLALLTGSVQTRMEAPKDSILIAEELSPSEAAQLDRTKVLGLCTTTGGPTGHVAILARSLGIPAVCGIDEAALELPDKTIVVLDGTQGILKRAPGAADLAQAKQAIGRQALQRVEEQEAAQKPAVTADGCKVEVAANIRNAQEAREAVAAGAQGVGLLRSEFLFLDRETAPTEDEQAAEYSAVARIMGPGRKLVIRTLDVGGDKPLAYLPLPREANPFLGMRGVRVSLDRPDLFRTQLRAILRAAPLGDLHIMFPMIATLEELRAAKAILAEEAKALGGSAKAGVMIEVPSAVLIADALAEEADFFSIGTNDLTQYCMAMDRGHPQLAKQADALHPSVLKLIGLTAESAHRHGKWVGICGGLASDVLAIPALLGLGVDELSVSVPAIGAVKARIARLRKGECEALARELLKQSTAAAVRALLAPLAPVDQ